MQHPDLSPTLHVTWACEGVPRLLPSRATSAKALLSVAPASASYLLSCSPALTTSTPSLVIAQTGPRTGISTVALSLRAASLHPLLIYPTTTTLQAFVACIHAQGRTPPPPPVARNPTVTGQAAVTMEPEGKAPDTVSAIIITMPP